MPYLALAISSALAQLLLQADKQLLATYQATTQRHGNGGIEERCSRRWKGAGVLLRLPDGVVRLVNQPAKLPGILVEERAQLFLVVRLGYGLSLLLTDDRSHVRSDHLRNFTL